MTFGTGRSLRRSICWGSLTAVGVLGVACPARAAITLSGDAATTFEAKVFLSGLAQPTDLAVLPDGRVIIIQKGGDLATVPADGGTPIEDHIDVATSSEQGLLGIVPDPKFESNHFIYVYADNPDSQANRHQILRYVFGDDSKLGSRTVVLSMGLEGPANHDGGGIDVYDGNLYMGVGDTGANASPPANKYGSCLNKGNGKVLRISLDEATLGQPAAGNPLLDIDMVTACDSTGSAFKMDAPRKEIFAWGFRNPYRVWVDKTTGNVWVGDVGEVTREEIDIVEAGKHYGYPFFEGIKDWKTDQPDAFQGQCKGMTPATDCTPPVFDYDRAGKEASVIGGRILDGCGWPAEWKSRYVFGDYNLNQIWTIDVTAQRDGVVANSQKAFATSSGLTGIRMGTDNALYFLEESGAVTRVTAKGSTSSANSCPAVNADPTVASQGGATTGGSGAGGSTAPAAGQPASSGGGGGGGATTNPEAGTKATAGGSAANAGSGDSSGCGCQVAGRGGSWFGVGALLIGVGVAARRRRSARGSETRS